MLKYVYIVKWGEKALNGQMEKLYIKYYRDELGFGIGSEQAEDESILSEETKKIKSNVNKKLRKTVICSVLVVMAIFGGIFFVVSPIMDSLYYNPASKNLNPEYDYQNINCDINVITELNMPEKTAIAADADRLGFARYDVTYTLRDPFSGKFYDFHSKISSGKSTGKYDLTTEWQLFMETDLFVEVTHGLDSKFAEERKEVYLEHLKLLHEHNYVSVAASFKKDISTDELILLRQKYPKLGFLWAAIRASEYTKDDSPFCIGTNLYTGGIMTGDSLNDRYPALSLGKWLVDGDGSGASSTRPREAIGLEKHYKSMLKYLIDRKEVVDIFDEFSAKYDFYKKALEYAEQNKVKSYGVLVYGEAKDILEFAADENVYSIEVRDVKVSKFSK